MRSLTVIAAIVLLGSVVFVGCNGSTESTQSQTDSAADVQVETVRFANEKCPIMGGKPSEQLTAQYDGRTIGFCCEGCPEKWAELEDESKAEKFSAVRISE